MLRLCKTLERQGGLDTRAGSLEHTAAHTAHASHAAHATTRRSRGLLLGSLDDGDLRSTQEGGDTAGVNQGGTHDLEGVHDTGADHVNILALRAIESAVEVIGKIVGELANNDAAFKAGILNNSAGRAGDGALDDAHTKLLVEVGWLDLLQAIGGGLEEGGATTGEDAFLNSGASSVQGINDTVLLLANLDLGGTANLDNRNTAGELGKTLLELLLLVVRGRRVGHDTADLLATLGDRVLAAFSVEDDGVLLGDGDRASGAKHVGAQFLQLELELVAENGAVGEDTQITQDALAVVTEPRGLDGGDLKLAAELVQNADGESLALDILSNDDQGAAESGGGLEGGDDILNGRDLFLGQQDQGPLELDLLGLGVGDEVRRGEPTVEAHALGNFQLILQGLALLDSDHALLAHLLHGGGDELADMGVTVGGDGSNLGNLLTSGDVTLALLQIFDRRLDRRLNTAAQVHGVASSSDVLDRLGEDGTGEDSSGGGTVTSKLVGLGGNILKEAGTEVLELVLELNGLGDRDTVYSCQYPYSQNS